LSDDLALYFHWPYCSRICPYCDFNVTRARNDNIHQVERQQALFDAMLRDMETQAQTLGPRRLCSVFFGGGTPSLMKPEWVAALISRARELFPYTDDIEITLEANPTDVEIGRYRDFRSAGINRLSLGVQSLDDAALKFLGRNHSAREAMAGIEVAREVFGRVSLDLIYALPDQAVADWEAELRRAVGLGIEHISPYQLTIEPETAFGRAVRRGRIKPVSDERAEAFYHTTQSTLQSLGFEAYEVSNHANAEAARSSHNINVWRGMDYMGVGPGAHGRLTFPSEMTSGQEHQNAKDSHGRLTMGGVRTATAGLNDLKAYIAEVAATGTGVESDPLEALETEEERLMLGLRMAEGIDIAPFQLVDLSRASDLIIDGFLKLEGDRLSATERGRIVLDRLLFELLS
jgi:putative oxygen-independent coproporphyrinogen III oxidase